MGVQVSRICTIFYVKSVLKIFASFTVIMYVSILARVPPKKSQLLPAPYIVTFWFLQVDNSYVSLHRWTAKMQTGSYVSLHRRQINYHTTRKNYHLHGYPHPGFCFHHCHCWIVFGIIPLVFLPSPWSFHRKYYY